MVWKNKIGLVWKAVVNLAPLSSNKPQEKPDEEDKEEMGAGEQRKSSSANNPPPTPDSSTSRPADELKTLEEATEEQLKARQRNPDMEGVSLLLKAKSDAGKLAVYDAIHAKSNEELVATADGVTATATLAFHHQCCPDNPNHFCERCQAKIHLMSERRVPRMPDSNTMRRLELQARMRKKLLHKRRLATVANAELKKQQVQQHPPALIDKHEEGGDEEVGEEEVEEGTSTSSTDSDRDEVEEEPEMFCCCFSCGRELDYYNGDTIGEVNEPPHSEKGDGGHRPTSPSGIEVTSQAQSAICEVEPKHDDRDIDELVEYITCEDGPKRTPQKQRSKARRRAERRRRKRQQEGATLEQDEPIRRVSMSDDSQGDEDATELDQSDNSDSTVSSPAASVESSPPRVDLARKQENWVGIYPEQKRSAQVNPIGKATRVERLDLTGGGASLWSAINSTSSEAKTESSTTTLSSSSKYVHKPLPPVVKRASDAGKPKKVINNPVFPNLVLRKAKKPSPQPPAFPHPQMAAPPPPMPCAAPKMPTTSGHTWSVPMAIEKPNGSSPVLNSYEEAIALQSMQALTVEDVMESDSSVALNASTVEEERHDWQRELIEVEGILPVSTATNPFGAIGEETREARRRKRDQEEEAAFAAFRAQAAKSTKGAEGVQQKWPADPSGVGNFDFASIKDLWTYTEEESGEEKRGGSYLCGYRLPDFKFC